MEHCEYSRTLEVGGKNVQYLFGRLRESYLYDGKLSLDLGHGNDLNLFLTGPWEDGLNNQSLLVFFDMSKSSLFSSSSMIPILDMHMTLDGSRLNLYKKYSGETKIMMDALNQVYEFGNYFFGKILDESVRNGNDLRIFDYSSNYYPYSEKELSLVKVYKERSLEKLVSEFAA